MDFEIDTSGFDELMDKFEELEGSNKVTLNELFPEEFMKNYTEFKDLDELQEESDFEIDSEEDFKNIPDEDWDEFIDENTEFSSWEEMLSKGTKLWTKKQLDT